MNHHEAGTDRRRFMHLCGLTFSSVAAAGLLGWPQSLLAQGAGARPTSAGPASTELLEDLVAANHILAAEGVVDGFGHVSVRHDKSPERYLLSRSLAPASVTASDIIEYDLDSRPVDTRGQTEYLEKFIHGEIYKARPDVRAVVHNHSPAVIPFSVTSVPLRPLYHMSAFLGGGVPVFDIRREMKQETDMLIRDAARGAALARVLGSHPAALLRGHGCVVVADNVKLATFNCVYLQMNAELQTEAMGISQEVNYLSDAEAERVMQDVWGKGTYTRAWDLWKRKALGR
jgi:ribulose-5-phosphate 4-epimerase/fuculose-1-phosphate aldolase